MSNPIHTNEFKFYLRFNSLNHTDWKEIMIPVGMDGASFEKKQEPKRFARSIEFGAINEIQFIDAKGDYTGVEQVINIYGDTSLYLDWCLEYILHTYKTKGSETDIEFKITKGGVDFRSLSLDATAPELTDRYSYFKCRLVDNSKVADYKRRSKDKLNAFSTKGVFEQDVTPIPTFNYLRRAIPVGSVSIMTTPENYSHYEAFYGNDSIIYNPCQQIEVYGVANTLTSFETHTYLGDNSDTVAVKEAINNRTIIKAKRRITNLKIEITGLDFSAVDIGFNLEHRIVIAYGNVPIDDWTRIELLNEDDGVVNEPNLSYTVNIPLLEVGQRVWFYFGATQPFPTPSGTFVSSTNINIAQTMKIKMSANLTSFDSVVKAVRYVDLIKQGNKMVHNLPFIAPKFNNGSQYYNQAVFNKQSISQKETDMWFDIETLFGSVSEVGCDYELHNDRLFIDDFKGYYVDQEIGAFLISTDKDSFVGQNERFEVNKIIFNNKEFATDRDLENTTQATHTNFELKVQQLKGVNTKEIKAELIRDPFKIQEIVDLEINKPTTATADDDKLMIEEYVALAPNSFGSISAVLLMRLNNGKLEILNRDNEGDIGDVVINWLILGFGVGSNVQITEGNNIGNYTVFAVTNSLLTLTPIGFTPTQTGDRFFTLKYYYQNVAYQTRTNEGFSLVSGVPEKFANINYTIKRNLLRWIDYIASFVQYLDGSKKNIIAGKFTSNGNVSTQLNTESEPIIENADIISFPTPILSGDLSNTTCIAKWDDILNYLETYKDIRGYVRLYTVKGDVFKTFVKDLKYLWLKEELSIIGEDKYEIPELIIGNDLLIGGVKIDWWKIENDYFQPYDEKSRPLAKKYRYNFVILNGVTYNSSDELMVALNLLN